MKSLHPLVLAAAFLVGLTSIAAARVVRIWPYQELIETQTKLGLDIANVLKQCNSIRPGITRAELSKVFSTEGGLSTVTHRTYVYRDCRYVKVDVDFAPSAPKQEVEKPTDKVTRISKPYLAWSVGD